MDGDPHPPVRLSPVRRAPSSPACRVCGTRITRLYRRKLRAPDVASFTPSASDFGIFYDLYRCEGCHAVFAAECLSFDALAHEYATSLPDGYMVEEKNRRSNFRHLTRLIAGYVDPAQPLQLLDVGASTGLFLDTVRALYPHWRLNGIEASSAAVEVCRRLFGLALLHGMFESAYAIPDASQDVVTMLDFLEHVANPMLVAQAAWRCLKPGGILAITTPNIDSWTARIFGPRWWSFRAMHTLYFSPLSMRQMLARAGFRIVSMRGLIRLFSLRYCLRHLGWTIRGPRYSLPFPLALGDMLVIARKEEG